MKINKSIKEKDILIIKEKIIRGMSMLLVREVAMKGLAIGGQFFLIRLLLPEYFGIFAILIFIQNTAELFTDIGFSQAIIQKKGTIGKSELGSIFYVRMALSLFVFGVLFFLAPFAVSIFIPLDNQVVLMLRILAVIMLIKPYRTTVTALLERDLSYNFISIIDLSGIVVYYIVAITFAVQGFQAWSLIYAIVTKELFEAMLTLVVKRWLPPLFIEWKSIKENLHFGKYIQLGTVFSYLNQSTIPVLAGKLTGVQSVGFLNFSSSIANLPNVLIDNFGRIAFAGFSRIQSDLPLLGRAVERSISLLNLIIFLFIVLTLGFSKELVPYLFTDKWLSAIPSLYWFVASAYFYGGNVTIGHAMLAMGKSKEMSYISTPMLIVQWILPVILVPIVGFVGIAIGIFSGALTLFCGCVYLLRKNHIRFSFVASYLRSSVIMILSLIFISILNQALPNPLPLLLLKVVLSILFYMILVALLSKNELRKIIDLTSNAIRQR